MRATRALAIDCDKGLPTVWHQEPSIIVRTSTVLDGEREIQKGQGIWLVEDLPVGAFKGAQRRLAAFYNSDALITNPSRVLRLPGTLHLKARAQLVTFEDRTSGLGRLMTLRAADVLAGLPAPERHAQESKPADGPADVVYDAPETLAWAIETIKKDVAEHGTPEIGDASDPRAYALAGVLKDGPRWGHSVSVATIADLLTDHWAPPHFEAEWLYEKAARPHQNDPGCGQAGSGERTFGDPAKYTAALGARGEEIPIEGAEDDGPHPRIKLLNLAALRAMPDPVDLVAGMIVDRENVAIVGPPKSGKSYLALEIMLSIAAGQVVVGGCAVRRSGPVVYLSGEGHAGFKRRVEAWRRFRGMSIEEFDALPFFYNAGVPLAAGGFRECKAFIEAIRAMVGEPVAVVIDTMARSLGGLDENAAASASLYLDMTEGLRAGLDCTTLTIAHSSNKGDKPTFDFRGSSAFSAGFDSVWTLNKCDANNTVEFRGRWFKEHDVDSRGPYYFKQRQDENGIVLEAAAPPARRDSTAGRRTSLEMTMRAYGMIGWRNALTDQEFAERRAGDDVDDSSSSQEDKARRYSEWAASVADNLKDLQDGARSRAERAARYAGLFQAGVAMAFAMDQVGRPLRTVEQGKKAPTVTRLWFVPDHPLPETP